MVRSQDALIACVLDAFARQFPRHAVLRGGMVLRVLGSPRFTNDLDYLFVPYRSKKDVAEAIYSCLSGIPGAKVSYTINSKCLRAVITVGEATVQVEAKVAMAAATSLASTRLVARPFGLPPRMVLVVEHSVALANKLAAWNERRLIRDIYDAWFFLQMGVLPDQETLQKRLKRPVYSRLVDADMRFKGTTVHEFCDFIREQVSHLTDADVAAELADYLSADELPGLAMQFRAAFVRLR